MAKTRKDLLASFSTAELKRMIVTKERTTILEARRSELTRELKKIDKEIAKLMAGGTVTAPRKQAAKKKAAKKPAGRKAAPKAKLVAKKAGKRTAKKPVSRAPRKNAPIGARLEDVVIQVIQAAGKEMSYPDIKATIASKKLYKSKSKNFDNVLRRTISTAKGIKRVGRGVYAVK